MNKPSRSDYYLMQIALQVVMEVRSLFSKKKLKLKLKQFLIKFTFGGKAELSREQKIRMSKAGWLAGLGLWDELERPKEEVGDGDGS